MPALCRTRQTLPGFWKKIISMADVVGSWLSNASEPCMLSCSSLLHGQHAHCRQRAPGQPACGVSKWTRRDGSALGGGHSWVTAESARGFMEGISLLSLHLPSILIQQVYLWMLWLCLSSGMEKVSPRHLPTCIHARHPHSWLWAQSSSGHCWVVVIMPKPGETPPGNAGCKFRSNLKSYRTKVRTFYYLICQKVQFNSRLL